MPQVYPKLSYLCWKLFVISINCNRVKERREALKKTLKKITFNFQVNNGEWFTWIQLSDQELRNSKFLKWRYTVNIANRLTSQHLHFLWGCLTCSSFSVAFQADSDFYVVAELLKDYIGLIQAVKVWSDVLMSAVILCFNNQLLLCHTWFQHPENWKIILKISTSDILSSVARYDPRNIRSKLKTVLIPCFVLLLRIAQNYNRHFDSCHNMAVQETPSEVFW